MPARSTATDIAPEIEPARVQMNARAYPPLVVPAWPLWSAAARTPE